MAKTTPPPSAEAEQDDQAPEQPAAPEAPKPSATGENRFFTWLRGLNTPREPGWIGGVCAGIAARLGIDPLIVRGIVVVLAVLGAPVVLAYAAAWLLLPDRNGQIHAQELGRGHVTPAFPAIVGLALLSFLPLTQGFWYLGGIYWGQPDVAGGIARAVWMAILVAAVVVLVIWLSRRAGTDVTTGPATTDDRPETIPAPPSSARTDTGSVVTETAAPVTVLQPGEPAEPVAPPADASAAELAAWKKSQEEWKKQRAEWVAEQSRAEYEQRQADRRARSAAAAAASAERRRIQKIVRPRASGAIHALVLGLALIVGAFGAFVASTNPETHGFEWAIGIAAATTLVGVAAVIVGLARRRSGFLAFLGIVGVVATVFTVAIPQDRRLLPPGVDYSLSSTQDARVIQLGGTTSLWVDNRPGPDPTTVDVWQLGGGLNLSLLDGASVQIVAVVASGDAPRVALIGTDGVANAALRKTGETDKGETTYEAKIGSGAPDLIVHVWSGGGQIWINHASGDEHPVLPITPAPNDVSGFPSDGPDVNPFTN